MIEKNISNLKVCDILNVNHLLIISPSKMSASEWEKLFSLRLAHDINRL